MKSLNRFRCTFFHFHFDKAKTFGLSCEFIFDDRNRSLPPSEKQVVLK